MFVFYSKYNKRENSIVFVMHTVDCIPQTIHGNKENSNKYSTSLRRTLSVFDGHHYAIVFVFLSQVNKGIWLL